MLTDKVITLDHGAGGTQMRRLIEDTIVPRLSNPSLNAMLDSALLGVHESGIAFTTDSYVVHPIEFPGGDIGTLAVSGTVNDLLVVGATPAFLSLGMIVEEGLPLKTLERIVNSISDTAKRAHVEIVTGDTKVVPRGSCDKLFINTSGIGLVPLGNGLSTEAMCVGDKVIVSGTLGDHALAIHGARSDPEFMHNIQSDCTPLVELVTSVLTKHTGVKWMRDATRGGVAAAFDELSRSIPFLIEVDEASVPVRDDVRSLCELLGFDPLHLANEGKVVMVVASVQASELLSTLRSTHDGRDAQIVGELCGTSEPGVVIKTSGGGRRRLRRPSGELLPRIC
ncbi:MAG: hydrogenase expression/formation protein HypE [Calditrichaeota bacterium]|nr:hydrogenase expression/formation protein HypE [Calditrichota bacterium]